MKQLIFLGILLLFLGFLTGANIYLSQRFTWYFNLGKTYPMYLLFGALTLLIIGGLIPLSNATGMVGHVIYIAAAVTMGVLLHLLMSVLLIDGLRLVTRFSPLFYGIVAITLTTGISVYGMWNAWNIRTTQLEVPVKGLTREIRAMHLSDIHIGHFRGKRFLKRIVDETNKQNVEVVFLTGDLFDGRWHLNTELIGTLQKLDAPLYFIEGNHEGYTGADTIKQMLKDASVNVLENEVTHHKELQIIGLNHLLADKDKASMHATGKGPTIKDVLNQLEINSAKPAVLLHHSPDGIQYAHKKGVDLYLSGHTHAGQLFPITLIAGMIYKYNQGLYNYRGTKVFVSQGAGTFGPPMRTGTQSEITVVRLIPE